MTFKRILAISLIISSIFSSTFFSFADDKIIEESQEKEMKGVWVATVYNLDYPSKPTTDSKKLKEETISILNTAQENGFNAIFLQIRPASDAFYKSKYFPWSKYLTGSQGLAPSDDFDPLKFWIEESHKRNIELHGWLNPYRITKKSKNDPDYDTSSLDPLNPAIKHPEWVVKHTDGNLYYNPGIPEVRDMIVDSTIEIIENYDIDGIHFDDYFYPGRTFNDESTFKKYGSEFFEIENWRRNNVNLLISSLYKAIKDKNPNVSFGISPFGIWANKSSNALGSNTSGSQSFYDHFADSKTWIKEGYIDYIAPQLYWNIGFEIADYEILVNWWSEAVKNTDVKLYIGQAAYKSGNENKESPWYGSSEIRRQLELNKNTENISGSIFYRYKFLINSEVSKTIKDFYLSH